MGTVFKSQTCHYCGNRAESIDHVVPRCDLPKPMYLLPYWFRVQNEVPACKKCNGEKAWFRSDCTCPQCKWAWNVALACYLPDGYEPRGYVKIVRSPG